MNPDAYRDAMDRSSIPYDGNQEAMKVTAGLDELSLKKQLPLRQQANKPMFKYNTSKTQSVHLFNQGDIGMISKDPGGVNSYNFSGMYYTGNINAAHQILTLESTSTTPKAPQHALTQGVNRRTSNASNPYVRPVSATEVAANINGEKARKMVESTISTVAEKTSTDVTNHSLQRNSFLRPLSGIGGNKDKSLTKKQSQSPSDAPNSQLQRQNSSGSESSVKQYNESKVMMKTKFQFASTASSSLSTPLVSSVVNKVSDTALPKKPSQTSASQGYVSPPVRNPDYSPNKPYKEDVSSKESSPESYTCYTAPPHNMTKASSENRDGNTYGHKPNRTNNAAEEATYQKTPDNQSKVSEISSLKKMPVTNTLTGTLYYRKASLSDHLSYKTTPSSAALQAQNGSFTSGQLTADEQQAESANKADSSVSHAEIALSSVSQVTSKPPLSRPPFERSNASIQLHNKPLSQEKRLSLSQGSIDRAGSVDEKQYPKKSITQAKPLGTKQSGRTPVTPASKPLAPRHAHSLSNLKGRAKPGPVLSALEHRPKADGAPAKNFRNVEKKMVTASKMPSWDDDLEEDDDDAEDSDLNDEDDGNETTPSGERLPGDGEASFEDYDDDEDDDDGDALDNFEGSVSDGESDGYSINSRGSSDRRSASGRPMTSQSAGIVGKQDELLGEKVKSQARPATASGNIVIKPALRFSLFKNIPPTVNFVGEGEKTEQLPWELRKLLKWKMSPITPIVVKRAIGRVGFRISKRNHDWLGCFGKHMKAQCFKSLREYQKLNHFPGSFQIGRKDRLWRNLSRMQVHYGKREFNFFPHTFVLPADLKQLKRAWEDGNSKQKWIIKPPASARGIGIRVISKWSQIPRRKPVIVQKYLARPYLINDSKFDMRIYVYVSSYDPLRIYVYEDGLARFASCKYSSSMKSLNNRYMHLTNYSVNKKNAEYLNNTDNTVCQGHKWSLKALWNFLKRQGINTALIWDNIRDLIIKTIICGDSAINSMTKSNSRSRYCCHELFGFDILLDENLKPWILEVNISPSLHSNSQLDINIKGGMIKDLMNIAGFRLPDERDASSSGSNTDFSAHVPPNKYCMDKRLFTNQLSPDERAKHAYYCQKHQDEQIMQSILDIITPDDMRLLCESIDEDSRKGNFQRLFPTPHTHRYLRFFEQPRYYNLLLDQWVMRYNRMEQRGILLLQSFCEEKIHVENPTTNSRHQWAPPNSTAASLRAADIRPLAGQNSARGSAPAPVLPRVLKKLPPRGGQTLSQSSSTNSLQSLVSSPQLHTPSPIGPIGSPSR
ncbi:tubulin polyglutamylase TTLL4 isoform X2 [Aplysia californica]|uniref:Tubulin polyglutamylase TTLL4 isoform X2 n=1 Tax=Aplysia californica TaxID=6500 RepID=A0ABM0JZJ3_APLCA|nr:tubulin polyglutamylase TTLL4 isoform X2 [Aplysia californica]